MTEIPMTFPDPEIPKRIPYTGIDNTKTYVGTTYLKKKNIDKAISHKLSKRYVYKTDTHKIYNVILGQKNEQIQDKAESDSTFQTV